MSTTNRKSKQVVFPDLETLEQLLDIGRSLTTAQDLGALLAKIAKAAGSILCADVVVLYEYRVDTDDVIIPPTVWGELRQPDVLKEKGERLHRGSLVFKVLRESRPMYATDAVAEWAKVSDAKRTGELEGFIQREGIASSAATPLTARKEKVGIIFVNYRTRHTFSEEETRILELFAAQAAAAIQNTRLFRREQEQRQRAKTLQEVARIVNSAQSLDEVVPLILDQLHGVIEYNTASVQTIQGDQRVVVGERVGERGFEPQESTDELHRNISQDPLVGEIIQQRRPLVLGTITAESHDPRWNITPATEHVKSWIGVPLITRDRVIGLLTLDHKEVGHYTQESGELAAAFADQVATAINKETKIKQLTQLHQILGTATQTLDPARVLPLLVGSVNDLFGPEVSSVINLYDRVKQEFRLHYAAGPMKTLLEQVLPRREGGVSIEVVRSGKPAFIDDGASDPRVRLSDKSIPLSFACLPLRGEGQVWGTLYIRFDQQPHHFSDDEKWLLELFADGASVAYRNAQLYKEMQERAKQLVQLQAVTAGILAKSHALEEGLRLIVAGIALVFEAFSCTVRLYDPQSNQFGLPIAAAGAEDRQVDGPPRSNGTSQHIRVTKQAVYAEDVSVELPNGQLVIRPENQAKGAKAVAYLPLLSDKEVIGRLAVTWNMPRLFSKNDKRMLNLFADQAATSVKIAQLYNQVADKNQQLDYLINRKIRDLKAVYEVSRQLTSGIRMSEQDVLALIHKQTETLMDTANMYIALHDEATDTVRFPLMYVDGQPTQVASRHGGRGRTEWIIQNRKPIFIETRAESVAWYEKYGHEYIGEPFASWVGVPMMAGDKVLGVIATYHKTQDHLYTKDDQEILELMANQAAIVLQNARTWEAMQKLSEDLSGGNLPDAA